MVAELVVEIAELDDELMEWHRANALSRAPTKIPGVGPIVASPLVARA